MELHQSAHVGKSHVIGARGNPGDGGTRSTANIDGDVKTVFFEVPLFCRQQEQGAWAFESPVELKADWGVRLRKGYTHVGSEAKGCDRSATGK
jgi:hypothetical protein